MAGREPIIMLAGALYPEGRRAVISERFGIVRCVIDLPIRASEPSIFVCAAQACDTARLQNLTAKPEAGGGAGLSRDEARRAVIGECLERYCSGFFNSERLVFGTYAELATRHPLVHPSDFALFHPSQYRQLGWPPFAEDTPIAWTWAVNLQTRASVLVPAGLVYLPYHRCFEGEAILAPQMSTGLACGDTYEEAVLKGLYEVVERDAFMIMWLNQLTLPQLSLDTDKDLAAVFTQTFDRPGLKYVTIDMTSDVAIPCVFTLLIDEKELAAKIVVGGAAHLDIRRAALKAMIEAVQGLHWARYLKAKGYRVKVNFDEIASFEDHVVLYAYGDMRPAVQHLIQTSNRSNLETCKSGASDSPEEDLETCIKILAASRLDVAAVDLTTPDVAQLGFHVVRVLVPSLQPLDASHRHRFLGGTRLYEVPARMGYRKRAAHVNELNPWPHPYP